MTTLLVILGAYLAIGAGVALLLSQSPYGAAGWFWIVLLWPLFVFALLF